MKNEDICRKFNKILLGICIALATVVMFGAGCSDNASVDDLLDNALMAANNGNWKSVLDLTSKAVKKAPNNSGALLFKAIAQENCGEIDAAMETARRAAELYPANFGAQYLLGKIYASVPGRETDAVNVLLKALALKRNDQKTLLLLAQCESRLNRDSAINYYRQLQAPLINRPEVCNQMGIYFAMRNNLPEATKNFVNAYKASPNNPQIILNFARFVDYYYRQDRNQAIKQYQRYLDLTKGNPELSAQRSIVDARIKALQLQR